MEVDVAFLLLALALSWALTFLTSRDRITDYKLKGPSNPTEVDRNTYSSWVLLELGLLLEKLSGNPIEILLFEVLSHLLAIFLVCWYPFDSLHFSLAVFCSRHPTTSSNGKGNTG